MGEKKLKELKVFFDTEFNGLQKETDLISIGLCVDGDDFFYGEINYSDLDTDPWIKENVISKLLHRNKVISKTQVFIYDNKEVIRKNLRNWINDIKEEYHADFIQFVSDCSSYDFVLLVDLLSDTLKNQAISLPDYISPYCHDINQDITEMLKVKWHDSITDYNSFEINRIESLRSFYEASNKPIPGYLTRAKQHNSLYDSFVIRDFYHMIEKVKGSKNKIKLS